MKLRATTVIKAIALLALLAGMSAAGVKYVAVVETDVDAASGASADINPAEVRQVTAELRRQAAKNLPPDRYSVMTSETVQSMGGAVLEECADENCVITLGSRIGADYIVRGIISKFGTKLTLLVELYETDNGTLVISSEPVRSETKGELLEMATEACGNMFREFAGGQTQHAAGRQNNAIAGNTYNDNQSGNQYEDFTTGQRWGTWGLNILPGGLGSFLIMKDKIGGYVLLGLDLATILSLVGAVIAGEDLEGELANKILVLGSSGAGIFNIVRSITYHKPKPKSSATAANFNPYAGLKLSILPTQSGDYKVFARYDYSF